MRAKPTIEDCAYKDKDCFGIRVTKHDAVKLNLLWKAYTIDIVATVSTDQLLIEQLEKKISIQKKIISELNKGIKTVLKVLNELTPLP